MKRSKDKEYVIEIKAYVKATDSMTAQATLSDSLKHSDLVRFNVGFAKAKGGK